MIPIGTKVKVIDNSGSSVKVGDKGIVTAHPDCYSQHREACEVEFKGGLRQDFFKDQIVAI